MARPVIHGRDHARGGADPIPGLTSIGSSTGGGEGSPSVGTGTSYYYNPAGNSDTNVFAFQVLAAYPVFLRAQIIIESLIIGAASGGAAGPPASLVRMGIYADSGFGWPGDLIVDGGTVSGVLSGNKEVTVALSLATDGWYWLAYVAQGSTTVPTVRSIPADSGIGGGGMWASFTAAPNSVVSGYSVAGVTGALPDPFGTPPFTLQAEAPRICLKWS